MKRTAAIPYASIDVLQRNTRKHTQPMTTWKLIHVETGVELRADDLCQTFRGEKARITSLTPPTHAPSTGRVYIRMIGDPHTPETEQGYYPGVIGAKFIRSEIN